MRLRNSIINCIGLAFVIPMLAGLVVIHAGCASRQQSMLSGSTVPASEGTVSAIQTENGNTKVSIRVKHLAVPSKVAPDATVYVVWIKPRNGVPQNVGAMILNKNLEGSLDTVTSHNRFQVIITPEPSGRVREATHEPVFTSNVKAK